MRWHLRTSAWAHTDGFVDPWNGAMVKAVLVEFAEHLKIRGTRGS